MSKKQTIKLKALVNRRFYNDEESGYRVYSFKPLTNSDKVKLHPVYETFTVDGHSPNLIIGDEYEIEIEPYIHKKYGQSYKFVSVLIPEPKTVKEQQSYLKQFLTEGQYQTIIEAYPNDLVLDLLRENKIDVSKLKGIKEASLESIRTKLFKDEEANRLIVELKDLKITLNRAKKLIEHFGSSSQVVTLAKENIYKFCEVEGFGFKTVDSFALNRGDDPLNPSRIYFGIVYIIQEDSDKAGNTWINRIDVIEKTSKLLGVQEEVVSERLKRIAEDCQERIVYVDKQRVGLMKNYRYEREIYIKLGEMINSETTTFVENIDSRIDELERRNGFEYTSEQRNAIKKAITNNVLVINGKGGVGKTTVLKGVIDALEDYSYISLSLSGKAVQVLMNNGLKAKTIHKALMSIGAISPTLEENLEGTIKSEDEEKEETKLPYDVVIIDEASMVNSYLFYLVVKSLKKGAKLILVGDSGQLPSIGAGAVFDNLIKYGDIPRQELTIVHRQAQKSGILKTANMIREGKQINEYGSVETQIYGELEDMLLLPVYKNTDIVEMVKEIAERNVGSDILEFQVVTARVDSGDLSVKNLNNELQKIFNNKPGRSIKRGGYEFKIGDKIIQSGNNYEAITRDGRKTEVFNGTIGIIDNIVYDNDLEEYVVFINFVGNPDTVSYTASEMSQVDLAYALTVHKCQGSEFEKLVFAFDTSAYMLLSKEFIYTGITRASKGCIMIADTNMLHMGIKRSHGNNRKTFLKDFLTEDDKI